MLRVGALVIGGFGLLLVLTLLSNGHETETRGKQVCWGRRFVGGGKEVSLWGVVLLIKTVQTGLFWGK